MLEAISISRRYGSRTVIHDFSMRFPQHGLLLLIGPSGSGKTTLLRLLAGLEKPDEGQILRDAQAVCCFQEYRLFPQLTALQNVTLTAWKHAGQEEQTLAAAVLSALGLDDHAMCMKPGALSGGMKQRVSLARALCAPAPILLLDEPVKELDEALRTAAMELIRSRARDALVIVSVHDEAEAAAWQADTVLTPSSWAYNTVTKKGL